MYAAVPLRSYMDTILSFFKKHKMLFKFPYGPKNVRRKIPNFMTISNM